jgi:hypothetical protein
LLDFLAAPAARPFGPGALAVRGGDAGELAYDRPAELACGEGAVELGQVAEGATDAQALFGLAWAQAQHAVGVFFQAGVSGVLVHREALGFEEALAQLPFVGRALATELDDPGVDVVPAGGVRFFR